MIPVEICLNSDNLAYLKHNVETVYIAGAKRIELCSNMQFDGLTPSVDAMKVARKAFGERPGLLVMIRPRSGDFFYNETNVIEMITQIKQAAKAGANGVVFGALIKNDMAKTCLNFSALEELVKVSKNLGLQVGIHRAFDAIEDKEFALTQLIALGVDRVLTSGNAWKSMCSAVEGLPTLIKTVNQANNEIEIVIAGGISINSVQKIYQTLRNESSVNLIHVNIPKQFNTLSFHAYSSVLKAAYVDKENVYDLVNFHNI